MVDDVDDDADNYQNNEERLQKVIHQCFDELLGSHRPHRKITDGDRCWECHPEEC